MGKRKRKVEPTVMEVLPASQESPEASAVNIEHSEIYSEKPTLTEAKVEDDPRYHVLKDTLKQILAASPVFDRVKDNPWLYLEWRNQIQRLVQ